jgi:uncharacterized RDD family membrane protein YckC
MAAWLASALFGVKNPVLSGLIFLAIWLGLRVLVPQQRQGQSLGRWAFDMRLISLTLQRTPDLLTLTKRETIVGVETLLALVGLTKGIAPSESSYILLILPLIVDLVFVLADPERSQTLHDRLTNTLVVYRRGYSLDLKLRRLLAEIRSRMKQ